MNTLKKIKEGLKTQDVDDKHYMSWMGFEFAISEFVRDYKENDYKCDVIYGPPRGGLPIAVTLSHRLEIPIIQDYIERLGKTILVVDDIADTGKTLEPLVGPNVIVYSIYYHPQSIVKPDCWIFENKGAWVVFPWEEDIYGYETNN